MISKIVKIKETLPQSDPIKKIKQVTFELRTLGLITASNFPKLAWCSLTQSILKLTSAISKPETQQQTEILVSQKAVKVLPPFLIFQSNMNDSTTLTSWLIRFG